MVPLRRWLASLLLVLLVVGVGLLGIPGIADASRASIRKGSLTPLVSSPPGAEEVRVGLYSMSVYDLDLSSNTFYADAYVWLRWSGQIDPVATLEFTNMVEEWGKLQEPILEEPRRLPDGSNYQLLRVEGRFVQPFSLADYPLDGHALSILMEDTTHGLNQLTYVIDRQSSGVSSTFQIPGWQLAGWKAELLQHSYGTDFGDVLEPSRYAVARFEIEIRRPISFFVSKLMLPLVIVVVAALVALLVNPRLIDARLALPLGALLSAIFLQKSYADSLPDLGYLVLMDRIYLLAYPLILVVLIRSVRAYMVPHPPTDAEVVQIRRADRKVMAVLGLLFVLGTVAITLLR